MNIIENARELFFKMIDDFGKDPRALRWHLTEVERRAKICLQDMSADEEIVMLWVRLHDVGHYPIQENVDHAVSGEKRAIEFLEAHGYDPEKIKRVAHCVRAHRCKDVLPETLEAKIIAFADSASHMTQNDLYIWMAKRSVDEAIAKLERDYRDLAQFPNLKEKASPLYLAWKNLLQTYEKVMWDIEKK